MEQRSVQWIRVQCQGVTLPDCGSSAPPGGVQFSELMTYAGPLNNGNWKWCSVFAACRKSDRTYQFSMVGCLSLPDFQTFVCASEVAALRRFFWTSILLYFNFFLSILLNFIDNVPKHVLKAGWQRWSTFGFVHLHSIVMYNIIAHWFGLARFRARMFCALCRNIRFKIRIAGETRKQKCTTRANLREIVNNNVAVVKGTAQVRTSNEDR